MCAHLVKVFERFQTTVKANIYEIECNTRSVINTLETKIQSANGEQPSTTYSDNDPVNNENFHEETQHSLQEAQKVLDMLQKSMSMGLSIVMPNFNLKREISYDATVLH